jgi:hypothetical protein
MSGNTGRSRSPARRVRCSLPGGRRLSLMLRTSTQSQAEPLDPGELGVKSRVRYATVAFLPSTTVFSITGSPKFATRVSKSLPIHTNAQYER